MTCPACSRELERTAFGTTRLCRCGHEGVEQINPPLELGEAELQEREEREIAALIEDWAKERAEEWQDAHKTPADLGRREEKKPEIEDPNEEVCFFCTGCHTRAYVTRRVLAAFGGEPPMVSCSCRKPGARWVENVKPAPTPDHAQERGARCWWCGDTVGENRAFCDNCAASLPTGKCLDCGDRFDGRLCEACYEPAKKDCRAPGFVPRRERR